VKNTYIIFLLFFIIFGCGKNATPSGILDEDRMVEILIDIHLAEGLVSTFPINYDSSRALYPFLEQRVFEKHQLSDTVFMESLQYYLRDPKKMDRLYARTIDSLNVYEKVGEQ
jgi:hypothetical protein